MTSRAVDESIGAVALVRNLGIYIMGIGMSVFGALGLADAITLRGEVAMVAFLLGLCLVILVHERLDGPI